MTWDNRDRLGYNDEAERIPYEVISERTVRARKSHPCAGGSHNIETGESYVRVAEKVDGEFGVRRTCLPCDAGYPRPGSAEEAALIAECEAVARQDEADYQAEQAMYREWLTHPDMVDADVLVYARAAYAGPLPTPEGEER